MPGAWKPVIGNMPRLAQYDIVSAESEEPLPVVFRWMIERYIDPDEPRACKYENYKAVLMNIFGKPLIFINDPAMAHDVF